MPFVEDSFKVDEEPEITKPPTTTNPIQEWKRRLLQEPPEGDPRANPVARTIRALGDVVLPESVPGAVGTTLSMVPGAGVVPFLARLGAGATLSAGAEALRGESPWQAAGDALLHQVPGEALGAAGRFATRNLQAARETAGPYTSAVGQAIERVLPIRAHGQGPAGTVENVLSGEAQRALSEVYRQRLNQMFRIYGNPTMLLPPHVARSLGIRSTGAVTAAPAHDVLDAIASVSRSLRTAGGDTSRRKSALSEIGTLRQAQQDLEQALQQSGWPANALAAARAPYARGKAILRLFGGGRDITSGPRIEQLISPQGQLIPEALQSSFLGRLSELRHRLSSQDFEALQAAIRRGDVGPALARDVPGRGLGLGGHASPHGGWAYLRHLPRAPKRVGEGPLPEDVARALRVLGVRSVEEINQ